MNTKVKVVSGAEPNRLKELLEMAATLSSEVTLDQLGDIVEKFATDMKAARAEIGYIPDYDSNPTAVVARLDGAIMVAEAMHSALRKARGDVA